MIDILLDLQKDTKEATITLKKLSQDVEALSKDVKEVKSVFIAHSRRILALETTTDYHKKKLDEIETKVNVNNKRQDAEIIHLRNEILAQRNIENLRYSIISGMKIPEDASKDQIMIEVEKVLNLAGIDLNRVEDAKIIPWRTNSVVKCRFTSAAVVRSLLRNSSKLKGTEVYIQQELSVDQRRVRNFAIESGKCIIADDQSLNFSINSWRYLIIKSGDGVKEFLYESFLYGAAIVKAKHEWVYPPTTRKKNIPAQQAGVSQT
ncbi:unnamed protein product [Allacma fusca]|uniref:Uncharacterized protein n=1 Tax=Allacma fusca TaxID=39272 RepID=A0A8J2KI35_9HEXA|nr:unnamed protein product [Allacma fusca]